MTPLDIFVSSKMQELAAERQALYDLLPTLGGGLVNLRAWVFEAKDGAPASEQSIRETYLENLHKSQLYIGLFWNIYGEWTRDEFEQAGKWGIDRLIFVKNVDAGSREPRLQKFLDEHSNVPTGMTPNWFTTVDELCERVRQSIEQWIEKRLGSRGSSSAILLTSPESVPERPRKFIGRDDLKTDAHRKLDTGDPLLLQGFGGAGKTALAAEVTAERIERGQKPALWLEAGSADSEALTEALARAFSADAARAVAGQTGEARLKLTRDLLTQAGVKLVTLDNAWNGAALKDAVKAVPRGVGLLVTARQHYALEGGTILDVGDLPPTDALRLLGYYAGRDFMNDPKAADLCRLLGYHAFALEIAGKTMQARKWTPERLMQEIKDAPHEMEVPADYGEKERHSVKDLLDASLHALDEETRAVFLAFGALFAPRATAEMLALYIGNDKTPPPDPLPVHGEGEKNAPTQQEIEVALTILMDNGLAERLDATPDTAEYWRIHDLAYSYTRAQASDEQHGRALDACLTYTERYKTPSLPNFAALRPELDNFLGAADWAFTAGRLAEVEGFVTLYRESDFDPEGGYLYVQSYASQVAILLTLAAQAAELLGNRERLCVHLSNLMLAYAELGQYDRAIKNFHQAITISVETKNRKLEGNIRGNLGLIHDALGDYNSAIECDKQSLTIHREIGNRRGEANTLANLGVVYRELGRHKLAILY